MAMANPEERVSDEELFDLPNVVFCVEDTKAKVPIPLRSFSDLQILVQQAPEDQLIHMRGLSKLCEAGDALRMMCSLSSLHGWKIVGGMAPVSKAAQMDEELYAIEALTLPLLKLDLEDEDGQPKAIPYQRMAMKPLLQQVTSVRGMADDLGPTLLSEVNPLFNLVNHLYDNPPISHTHIKQVASLLEGVRDASVHLDDEDTLGSAIHGLLADARSASRNLYSMLGGTTGDGLCTISSQFQFTIITFQIRAISSRAFRLNKRVREIIKKQEARNVMKSLLEQVKYSSLVLPKDEGLAHFDTDRKNIESLLEGIRSSSALLEDGDLDIASDIDALATDMNNVNSRIYLMTFGSREILGVNMTKIRLLYLAIHTSAIRLDERVKEELQKREEKVRPVANEKNDEEGEFKKQKEEGLVEADEKINEEDDDQGEGGADAARVCSNQTIADTFRAILNTAVRVDERLKAAADGYPKMIDIGVAYDLREIRLQVLAIRNSAVCLDEQLRQEIKRQEKECRVLPELRRKM